MRILCFFVLWINVFFWNCENFFDYFDDGGGKSDTEFSSRGTRHWTKSRFEDKVNMVGKTIAWSGEGEPPAVVGLCEVENDFVLRRTVGSDVLRKWGYRYIHYDSRDPRGIDVALLYRQDRMEYIASYPIPVVRKEGYGGTGEHCSEKGRADTLATRDILYVCLRERSNGQTWHFFVNHHPSKYGGGNSGEKRLCAMRTLKTSVDSLLAAGARNIVAMGDFNDTPDGEAFSIMEGTLVNLGAQRLENSGAQMGAELDKSPEGSIRFNGKWELIDNFLVSPEIASRYRMQILDPPFLMQRDKTFPGEKPWRTYIGPRYNGGVSDHLPIRLER